MTVDRHRPEDEYLSNLEYNIDYRDVMYLLVEREHSPLTEECLKQNACELKVGYKDIVSSVHKIIVDGVFREAGDTNAWQNHHHPGSPYHARESVAEAVDDTELREIAAAETEFIMDEFLDHVENGTYEDRQSKFEVQNITDRTVPRSVFE